LLQIKGQIRNYLYAALQHNLHTGRNLWLAPTGTSTTKIWRELFLMLPKPTFLVMSGLMSYLHGPSCDLYTQLNSLDSYVFQHTRAHLGEFLNLLTYVAEHLEDVLRT
jgi:hypothetical protein